MLSPERCPVPSNSLFSVTVTRMAWLSFGGAIAGMLTGAISAAGTTELPKYFLVTQDAPALFLLGLFFAATGWSLSKGIVFSSPRWIERPDGFAPVWIATALVACAVYAGSHLIYQDFALSVDEFMAEFDATVIAAGHLLAPVAPEWREYVPALQPIFRLEVPENAYWISSYLPMNAALRAVFVLLGDSTLQGVALAGAAIVALFGVARRLWPDRADAAVVAVVLLASSSQFLITAMTPYAMTAHLALNLIWLWLFLRDTRTSHVLAAGVAFVACGLHQVIFHPLFAAPFLISLLRARRWQLATFYAAVYAAAGLFWILYWSLLLHTLSEPVAQSADLGIAFLFHRIAEMAHLNAASIPLMALNLYRFLAWQSPLAIPLALIAFVACRRDSKVVTDLALGIFFTLAAVLILMPYQGHGWGYRYLHGFLGSLSLLAAQGWIYLTGQHAHAAGRKQPAFLLLASVFVSVFVMLPWHAYHVRAFVAPYASAVAAIKQSDAEVVVVDPVDIWFGTDLVRNDPFLHNSPKVLALGYLDKAGLTKLCRRYDVAIFDRRDAPRFGLRIEQMDASSPFVVHHQQLREAMASLNCGRRLFGNRF